MEDSEISNVRRRLVEQRRYATGRYNAHRGQEFWISGLAFAAGCPSRRTNRKQLPIKIRVERGDRLSFGLQIFEDKKIGKKKIALSDVSFFPTRQLASDHYETLLELYQLVGRQKIQLIETKINELFAEFHQA